MFEAQYAWRFSSTDFGDDVKEISEKMNLNPLVVQLLTSEGFKSADQIKHFLSPDVTDLNDPFLMHDMQKAVERIQKAIVHGQQIVVYGDYDADGITSTTLIYEALEQLGAKVKYYIPDRFKDGYGPNKSVYKQLIKDGTELILTVDNGVSGFDAVQYANTHNVDVIITDHHELPQKLPEAYAIVHPRYPGQNYPFGQLAGVGVAFKLACALLDELPSEMLDLVAIGTVADLVPLVAENRALVTFGLNMLQNTQRPGLEALFKVAGLTQSMINEENIGFAIAPRLNSLGRLKTASLGVKLLTTLDNKIAQEIAQEVQQLNQKRQRLVEMTTIEALDILEKQDKHLVNVVCKRDWHEGILGIVASHLVQKTGRPSIVLSASAKEAKGSGRSVEKFQMFKALDNHKELMQNFGGHHMACGLTISLDKLDEFQNALDQEAQKQDLDKVEKPSLQIAAELSFNDIDEKLINDLKLLAPYGNGNSKPIFAFTDYKIYEAKLIGKKRDHLKLSIGQKDKKIDALAFSVGEKGKAIVSDSTPLKFVGQLSQNVWNGRVKPQILISDFAYHGQAFSLIDKRTKKLQKTMFTNNGTYVFFNEKLYHQLQDYLPVSARTLIGENCAMDKFETTNLILVDCPPSLSLLAALLEKVSVTKITMIFYPYQSAYLEGMPTRHDFAKVYRFVMSHQKIDIKKKLPQLATYLKLKKDLLIFMLQVFFEVGFVKMDNGLMTGYITDQVIDLKEAPTYHSRQQLIEAESVLLTSRTEELKRWVLQHMTVEN
ncbi:single-stranded-DNA-specific exonuclease [Liquorilactobacillus aquaticus DSM 21051]|uniref:Single-stranded-DNA-specific exonuclease RecJ n=1 Tax=Liquorilactobacillus aquaticus DSM 21051 TaxID=1423725 RepID=A0A0R2CZB7_9LACO|nr:single-stranded-DNA-specific exonuclease RecJ [Liquorilactobacillus aquaticus]KRM96594.1 single-stranded-DNA-specific exonuclease [Liquorilactobacillus aquaticus DSM 21051]